MKIELTCEGCQSILNIDSIYAGKKARCPECQFVNSIPISDDGFDLGGGANTAGNAPNFSETKASPDQYPNDVDQSRNPYQVSIDQTNGGSVRPTAGAAQTGLILGIISVVLVYLGSFFCCIFPFLGSALGIVGLLFSLNSESEYRTVGIVLNSLSILAVILVIGGIICWFVFQTFFFAM